MKIKKFNNIWTMGLILFGAILVTFYIAKLFFPEWIVGVAEIPRIVEIGEYIDSHLWAYYSFNISISLFGGYLFVGASCRKRFLTKTDFLVLCVETILCYVLQYLYPETYAYTSVICMLCMVCVICKKNNETDIKYLYSTILTFSIHMISQILSLEIRGIYNNISYPNSATFTILLIDATIWQILLYNYFNYKENKNG